MIYDVSLTLKNGMIAYPGDTEFLSENLKSIEQGDDYNISKLVMSSHTGTHIDAPRHFLRDGVTVDEIQPKRLMGRVRVVYIKDPEIGLKELKDLNIRKGENILFKTTNSSLWKDMRFHEDFTSLTIEAAQYLADIRVNIVGIDYLSIETYKSPQNLVHKYLLNAGIIIIEGLDLSRVNEGKYELICAPLKISEGNGAPARVFLIGM
ncbi:MAG: cyclase family protein [Thermotogae bacterium]|nr:cyclase family protein [Thermotogota bacterium]